MASHPEQEPDLVLDAICEDERAAILQRLREREITGKNARHPLF